jgi:hypothetical protein
MRLRHEPFIPERGEGVGERMTGGLRRNVRPPRSREEKQLAHEIAAYVGKLRAEGAGVLDATVEIDHAWPELPFKTGVAGFVLQAWNEERGSEPPTGTPQ